MSGCNFPNFLSLILPTFPGFTFPPLSISLGFPPIDVDFGLDCPID